MSVPKRHAKLPGTYFVTSRTWQGRAIFNTIPPCEIFVASLLHYRDRRAYRLHAFVLMPDHFHILLAPSGEIALERTIQFIKGGSAKAIRERLNFRFPVWQRGFSDHRIRDAADYELHLRYLTRNPVKKGIAAAPDQYRWSSASGALRVDEFPQGLKPLRSCEPAARLKPCPDVAGHGM